MIRPARAFIITGSACWIHKCAPVKFVCSTASQSSFFIRIARPSRVTAALFTRMSNRPNFSITCLNPAFTCSASATSIFTANAVPPAAAISLTSAASFSSFRAATATFAPACANASAVSRPIPCDAPVTIATLSVKLNILLCLLRVFCAPNSVLSVISLFARHSPLLCCVRLCPGNLLQRSPQTLLILNVQRCHRPLNLSQQSRQHPPRTHFHKRVHAFLNQRAYRLFPPHRHGNLPHQRILRFATFGLGVRVHIRHQRHAQIRKRRFIQILSQLFLRRHHQRAMKRRRNRQDHCPLRSKLRSDLYRPLHRAGMPRNHRLLRRI